MLDGRTHRGSAATTRLVSLGCPLFGVERLCEKNMTLAEQLRSKKKALTVEELADLLGIALRTLYKEVEDDHIPFFRVRTSIRFDPHQVADWLEMKMPPHSIRTERHPEASVRA